MLVIGAERNAGGFSPDAAATEYNSKLRSKACREKSAEVIVPAKDSGREGLWCAVGSADNPTEVYNRQKTIE